MSVLWAAAVACLLPLAASASKSPATLLSSILAGARAERSVHYTSDQTGGTAQVSFIGDAGIAEGIQRITYRKGTQTGHITVIVVSDTAYIFGDAFALVNYMGFEEHAAAKYENVWIVIPHTDSDYSTVAAGVNLLSTVDELELAGRLSSVSESVIRSQSVLGVRGTKVSSGHTTLDTLYARSAGIPLPVEETASQGKLHYRAIFNRWNETIHLKAPSNAVPISVVRAAPTALTAGTFIEHF
jgi:hypothetical protein